MMHQFCPVVAKEFGVNIAIFLQNLAFWTQKNLANEKHVYDGYCWTYNTLDAFTELFPYFTKDQIRTIIDKSFEKRLIVKGNYNKIKQDRTIWYALTPKAYLYFIQLVNSKNISLLGEAFKAIWSKSHMDMAKIPHGYGQNPTPLPDSKPNNKTDISESVDSSLVTQSDLINIYIEELPTLSHPRNPQKPSKELARLLNALIKRWPSDISEKGNQLTKENFRALIKKLKEIDYWMFKPEKDAGMIAFCRISNMQRAIERLIAHDKQGKR